MAFRGRGGFSSRGFGGRGFSSRGFGGRGFGGRGFGGRFDNGRDGYDDYYDDGRDYFGGRGGGFSARGGGFRGRGGYFDDYSPFRNDRGRFRLDFNRRDNNPDMGTAELMTKTLFIQSKKFYVDVKENKRGKFVRISEVAPNGQRMRLIFDLPDAAEFHEKLTELCEVYSNLGPEKTHQGYESEEKIKSDTIFRDNKRYFLDLKENHRGRFLKVSMTLPNNDRSQIVIPAHGMVEIRDALTDVLNEFGREDSKSSAQKGDPENTIEMENNKSISIETGSNARGTYMRLNEVTGAFRACITIAEEAWPEFIAIVEEAISNAVVGDTITIKDDGNETATMEETDE